MKKLESIINKGKIVLLAGLMFLEAGCVSLKHYIEPRAGLIVPVAEKEQAYDSSFLIGGAYGFGMEKLGLEAGLDCFSSSGDYITTNSLLSRINLSFSPLKQKAKVKPYLITGISNLSESSIIDIPEFDVYDEVTNKTSGFEFGVGTTLFNRINGRVTYTIMPKSENVKGMISLTAGYRFLFGGKK